MSKEAMKLALEALEKSIDVPCYGGHPIQEAAAVALREALAEKPAQQEPVAEARYDGTLHWLEPYGVGLHRFQGPLFKSPPAKRTPLTVEEVKKLIHRSKHSTR